ncbi:helix-turn-helix domain-containing protein [Vibrio campbellii]|nr:helix-turn-helix domain-containing protein [Vibrio campbellii]
MFFRVCTVFIFDKESIRFGDKFKTISHNEYKFLKCLFDNHNLGYVSRNKIAKFIWGNETVKENNINTLVYNIRIKFCSIGIKNSIVNIPRKGYGISSCLYNEYITHNKLNPDNKNVVSRQEHKSKVKISEVEILKKLIKNKSRLLKAFSIISIMSILITYFFVRYLDNVGFGPKDLAQKSTINETIINLNKIGKKKRDELLSVIENNIKSVKNISYISVNKHGHILISCLDEHYKSESFIMISKDNKNIEKDIAFLIEKCRHSHGK